MDKELKCPSCGAALHLVDEVELQVVPSAEPEVLKEPVDVPVGEPAPEAQPQSQVS